ncbi:hypothetical protein DIPPA_22624 [Diplonema papillatum]|nr:hypothetical protein DIPPA_22624 [Diplonema papillatum]|eukprot:gene18138-27935_t
MKYQTLCVLWVAAASPTWAAVHQAAKVCGPGPGLVEDSTQAAVRCCSLEGGCAAPAAPAPCPGNGDNLTFAAAQAACNDVGARVCAYDELKVCCGEACGSDSLATWFGPAEAPANETKRVDPVVVTKTTLGLADTVAVVALAFMGSGGALGAGRLSLVGSSHCYEPVFDPGSILHPTRLTLPGSLGGVAGCVIGNGCVVAVVAALHAAFFFWNKKSAKLRLAGVPLPPAYAIFTFLVLYQGFVSCGAALILRGPSAVYVFVGTVSLFLSVTFPFALHGAVSYAVDQGLAVYAWDAETSPHMGWLIGKYEWVPGGQASDDVYRFGAVFVRFTPKNAKFTSVECVALLIMASLSAIAVEDPVACGHKQVAMALAAVLHAGLYLHYQPCQCFHSNVAETLFSVVLSSGLLGTAIGHYRDDPADWGFDVASVCFSFAGFLLIIRTVLDVGALLYVMSTKRRERLADQVADGVPDECEATISKPMLAHRMVSSGEVASRAGNESTQSLVKPLNYGDSAAARSHFAPEADFTVTPILSPLFRSPMRTESPAFFGGTYAAGRSGSLVTADGYPPQELPRNLSFTRPRLPVSRKQTLVRSHRPRSISVASSSLARGETDPFSPPARFVRSPTNSLGVSAANHSALLPPVSPFSGNSSSTHSTPNTPHAGANIGGSNSRGGNPLNRRLPPLV